jgi:O-methyltransferase involved in polyketide biosynthesis
MTEEGINENRNFNTISPSAKSLLLMKGHTNIPFARQTAELLMSPEKFIPDFDRKDITFWARVLHFETRYWSIDQLLENLPVKNILELSSGFSFRSLELTAKNRIHYIDTDLPEVVYIKKEFINELIKADPVGTLEITPLNCLDKQQFRSIVNHFPDGNIAIVNEGLLMYLNTEEKEKLCKIIYDLLRERGGYWITADIYIRNKQQKLELKIDDKTKEFFLQHNIEDNKFESFDEAKKFFKKLGFTIDKIAKVERANLSSLKYFLKSVSLKQLFKIRSSGKMQETWRLRIKDSDPA